jgi:tetratricopeptide (TPR) repeat protein
MKRLTVLLCLSCLIAGCGRGGENSAAERDESPSGIRSTDGQSIANSESEQPVGDPVAGQPAVDVAKLIADADEAVRKRDATTAVRHLTQAISAEPENPQPYVKRAAILAEAGHLPHAVRDMSAAVRHDPDNHKLFNTRGYFHLLLKDYEEAERDFNAAIDRNADYPQAYNNRGLVFIAQEEQLKAINDFNIAIRLKPDYIDAHNNLGFVWLQRDKPERAIPAFDRAIELDENYINAWSNRGRAHLKLEEYEKAIADFTRAIEIQPETLQYYLHRSEAYKASGRNQASLEDIQHVAWMQELKQLDQRVARSPKDADLWIARGRHLLLRDRTEEALTSFETAVKRNPKHSRAYLARAALLVRQERAEEALKDCDKALELEPLREGFSLRGDVYFALERFDEAIADYDVARRFDSQVAQAYRGRAQQREAAGEGELAQADLDHADRLEKRLNDRTPDQPSLPPRAMVIEQTSFEQEAEETAPEPDSDGKAK